MRDFGVINMNGRAYDPLFAQMLSPDPTTQFPGFSQGYERYSYCMNNPLKYTDPTGYDIWDPILKILGLQKGTVTGHISTTGAGAIGAVTVAFSAAGHVLSAIGNFLSSHPSDGFTPDHEYSPQMTIGNGGSTNHNPGPFSESRSHYYEPGQQQTTAQETHTNAVLQSHMTLSPQGYQMLKFYEKPVPGSSSFGKTDYLRWEEGDVTKTPTIGYGHADQDGSEYGWTTTSGSPGITQDQANTILETDVAAVTKDIQNHVTAVLNQQQFDAVVIYLFNVGRIKDQLQLMHSLNIGDPDAYIHMDVTTSNHIPQPGLVIRRQEEQLLFSTGFYSH